MEKFNSMSGHSKWKTIKHAKGVQDAKRGAIFSRLSKDIIIATQLGGGSDIKFNTYLRVAVEKAKMANMTTEKIDKAIAKGMGKADGDSLLEKTYEVNGFGGVVILIDCETDNSNRTVGELKNIVNKIGAKLVPEGSLSWNFEELGKIVIEKKDNIDETLLNIISLEGVVDVENEESIITIYTNREDLKSVLELIKGNISDYYFVEANLVKVAKDKLDVSEEIYKKNEELIDEIKNHSDVVYVWDNIN